MAPPQNIEDGRSPFADVFRWCLERGRQTDWDAGFPRSPPLLRPTTMRDASHRCQAENTRYCGSNLGQSQDVEGCGKTKHAAEVRARDVSRFSRTAPPAVLPSLG